jgi:hypothetical protein
MSAKNWPSDGHLPILMEEMKVVYKNETFDALQYYKELVTGSEAIQQSIQRKSDQLQHYVARYFMKVKTMNKITDNLLLNL